MQVHDLIEHCEDIRLGRLTNTAGHLEHSQFACRGQDAFSLGFGASRRLFGVYCSGYWARLCEWAVEVEQDLRCESFAFGESCGSGCGDANAREAR
jgi:hypothetical protein